MGDNKVCITISEKMYSTPVCNLEIDYYGRCEKNIKQKKYWNGKLKIGRYMQTYDEERIILSQKLNNDSFLSRDHFELDFSRAFTKYIVPYKFILLLMCLKKKNIFLPDDVVKYLFQYIKLSKDYEIPHNNPEKYILVRDLGSMQGTNMKIKNCSLKSGLKFTISEVVLYIEEVVNEGLLYQDYFFRGIEMERLVRIHEGYLQNIKNDLNCKLKGRCGFPFVKCTINGIKYILIATSSQKKFIIGRNNGNEIYIDLPAISRTHCYIEYDMKSFSWKIVDEKSTNGIYCLLKYGSKKKSPWVKIDLDGEGMINLANFTFKIKLK
jgi:hypothetical protein